MTTEVKRYHDIIVNKPHGHQRTEEEKQFVKLMKLKFNLLRCRTE